MPDIKYVILPKNLTEDKRNQGRSIYTSDYCKKKRVIPERRQAKTKEAPGFAGNIVSRLNDGDGQIRLAVGFSPLLILSRSCRVSEAKFSIKCTRITRHRNVPYLVREGVENVPNLVVTPTCHYKCANNLLACFCAVMYHLPQLNCIYMF